MVFWRAIIALFLLTVAMPVMAADSVKSDIERLAAGRHQINEDTTFTREVVFEKGAVLEIARDRVVTFANGFKADDSQIFAGEGRVAGVSRLLPEWFGAVGDGVTDDTQAIQSAINCFEDPGFGYTSPKLHNVLVLRRSYLVSSLNVEATYVNIHAENAWLIAKKEGSYPHLIRFARHFCSITGRLSIEGSYNLGYESIINVNARHFVASNVVIWRASLPWLFGNRDWATSGEPGASELGDSEIVISSSSTVHCLRGVEAVGANTIIVMANCLTYSYPWTLPKDSPQKAVWEAADKTLVRSIGALVYFQGGKLANFNPNVPLVEVQPIRNTKQHYYSNYGSVLIANAHIEGGNFFAAVNPHKIPTQDYQGNKLDQKFVSFSLLSCGGYVTGAAVPIKTDPMFTGTIIVDKCNFYGDRAETFAELGNPRAVIQVDDVSLRNKWARGLSAVKGGMPLFSNRLILDVRGSAKPSVGAPSDIIYPRRTETDDTGHFSGAYNERNGQFTVPEGGLSNVQIAAAIEFQADAGEEASSYVEVLCNGKTMAVERGQGVIGTIRATFPTLNPGDVISVRARSADGKRTLKIVDGDLTYLQITASRS